MATLQTVNFAGSEIDWDVLAAGFEGNNAAAFNTATINIHGGLVTAISAVPGVVEYLPHDE